MAGRARFTTRESCVQEVNCAAEQRGAKSKSASDPLNNIIQINVELHSR